MPKISELTTLTQASNGDYYPIVDDSGNVTKKVAANKINPPSSVDPSMRTGGFKIGNVNPSATGSLPITGLGFRPKLVRFTLQSVTSSTVNYGGTGLADGTTQMATAYYNEQSVDNSGATASDKCILSITTNGTVVVDGSMTSFDSDGFTLNITTRTASRIFTYEAYA